jgi:hypothetical protein
MWNNGWQPRTSKNTSKNPPNVGSSLQNSGEMIYAYKNCSQVVTIYDISYDSNGYPLFLIYIDGQWIRKSAKYFKPYED